VLSGDTLFRNDPGPLTAGTDSELLSRPPVMKSVHLAES